MKSIHQFLPTFNPYDAIGNEVQIIQKTLKKLGYSSKIFAENIDKSLKGKAEKIETFNDKNATIIYHHSIGTNLIDILKKHNGRILLIYHNITPPEYFEGINDSIADLLRLGKKQLLELKKIVEKTAVDSEYNKIELEKLEYQNAMVLPILIDFSSYKINPKKELLEKFGDKTNLLYVGRMAPSKRIEELIKIFAYYNMNINPNSNLFLIGSSKDTPAYFQWLDSIIKKAKIKNVHWISNISDFLLYTYYQVSDVFIIMSEHEGFCVPLIQSMYFKIPIIAKNAAAIPFTLGDSGILIKDNNAEQTGELIDVLISNESLRNELIKKQTKRLDQIYEKSNESMILDFIK